MDVETLQALGQLAGSLTVQAVLLYWVFVERKRADTAWNAIQEDWQRQREREIDKASKNGSGL